MNLVFSYLKLLLNGYAWETRIFFKFIIYVCLQDFHKQWFVLNKKGNTSLHEAILANNYLVFMELANHYKEAGGKLVNKQKETVLRLLATQNSTPPIAIDDAVANIIESDLDVGHDFLDADGLTPIMRAVQADNLSFSERLWDLVSTRCPKFKELKGDNGQTFWHLLAKLPTTSFHSTHNFFTDKDICCQLQIKDTDENTELHLAIYCGNLDTTQFFLESYHKHNFDESLLDIRNKMGDTPGDMIGSLSYLTPKFEDFMWMNSAMNDYRSKWGIPTTKMDNYVNAIGVIAALLFTVTFTAAFTVPGGLDQEEGTPLLITISAFQVFIISDELAMCLSMIVVFCLLSILAASDKKESVKLMDFSITLLIVAFFITHLTFISGLYATLHRVNFWIAILTLILGLMLLPFMLRYLPPKFFRLLFQLLGQLVREIFVDSFRAVKDLLKKVHRFCKPNKTELPMSTEESHIQ